MGARSGAGAVQSSVEGKGQEGWDRAPPRQENLGLDESGAGNQRPGIISLASERAGKGRRQQNLGQAWASLSLAARLCWDWRSVLIS